MEMENLPDFDALWDFDHPDETERKFREILQTASGADPGYRAELLTQIARTQGLQRKFEEAHHTLDGLKDGLAAASPRVQVRYRLERGRVFNSSGQPALARPLFLEAYDLASAGSEDPLAVDAAHMLGIVEPPEKALEWDYKALSLAERSADPKARKWLGTLYNNIGWTLHGAGKYDEALTLFEKALAFREQQKNAPLIQTAKWCVARGLRSLGRTTEALDAQRALLAEFEAAGQRDGYVFEELGECLLALGRPEEARPWFSRAFEELSKDPWLRENEAPRLERLKSLASAPPG